MKFDLYNLDELISLFGIKYVFIESGKHSTERKCEEIGIDKAFAKHYWCELSWGSSGDEFDIAFNNFGDTLSEAIGECLNAFQVCVRNNEAEFVRAAKFHNIYQVICAKYSY